MLSSGDNILINRWNVRNLILLRQNKSRNFLTKIKKTNIGRLSVKVVHNQFSCRCLKPCSSARRRRLFWSESGSPRLSHLRGLLLPTVSTPTSPAVVGLWLVGYTRLRRCKFMDWLLQHCSCWCTKDSNSVCCTLLCVSSPALGSLTAAWVRYCMTNFTGSTSPTGCFSSWQWQFTGVWTATHRRTCRTTAFRPLVSTLGSTCVPPTVNCLQYLGSTLTAVGPFQLQAPQSGTLSLVLSGTKPSVQTVSDVVKAYQFARY